MFKNLMMYRIGPDWPKTAAELEAALAKEPFAPCGATQQKSVGWVAPRGVAHGALVESVDGQWLARFAVETKTVPASALHDKVQEAVAHIEQNTGRKVGKREQRDMRDDALLELLPQAFPRRGETLVWLEPAKRLLMIGASAQGRADDAISSLVRAAGPGFSIAPLQTRQSPQAAMAAWLAAEDGATLPAAFDIGRACELKGNGEEPAVIRFTRHDVATDEVRQHIAEGKLPTKLALEWNGRVRLTFTDGLQLKQIAFEDGVLDDAASAPEEDRFDADAAISTGELGPLIDDLIAALGGELEAKAPADAVAAAAA